MVEHLSLNDMIDFSSAKGIGPDFFSLAARVNSHLCVCDDCRAEYTALQRLGHAVDSIGPELPEHRTDAKLALSLLQMKEQLQSTGLAISRFIKGWGALQLRVNSLHSIESEASGSLTALFHPAYIAVAKSTSTSASKKPLQAPIIKSTLTDGKGSRISIGADGTLSFFLDKTQGEDNVYAVLSPCDEDATLYIRQMESYDSHLIKAEFRNVPPGNYFAALLTALPIESSDGPA